jgi:hypothetical protein
MDRDNKPVDPPRENSAVEPSEIFAMPEGEQRDAYIRRWFEYFAAAWPGYSIGDSWARTFGLSEARPDPINHPPITYGETWYVMFTSDEASIMPRPPYESFAEHTARWCAERGISRERLLVLLETQERMLQAAERGDKTYIEQFENKLRYHQKRVGEPEKLTKAQARDLWERDRLAHA